ncbi:hypothetical protein K488DRAFT_82469 [Vararia minispora EC-137]|uniref:Uncharacterized protein n=1 Tax=Vararia minispora EC-137 TaxID=1314806 RepID=A0ACB8QW31_9AGAM|nr:hypothetical protein K488DRAFT_82469 [Vararia minispora EC-137]
MLAFPTPRPPAQARRVAAANKASPPPPYVHDLSVDSAHRAESNISPSSINHWDDHSREELAGLLSRADGLIRQRERELSFTSEYSRGLHNSSRALKQTHQALLARLPIGSSPFPTPMNSPQPPVHTPHYYSNSLPRQHESSQPARSNTTPSNSRRTRRISVSPTELACLSDQNAELLQKLQDLEEESSLADKAGKRRLGKLEKEISLLHQELEEARAWSNTLEERNAVLQRSSAKAAVREHQREGHGNGAGEEDQSTICVDFAPSGTVVLPANFQRRVTSNSGTVCPSTPPSALEEPLAEDSGPYEEQMKTFSASSHAPSPKSEDNAREHALVSQLLLKVRELEDANAQISQNQHDTASKLHAAQLEIEMIRRLYEYLNDSADIDLQADEEDAPSGPDPALENLENFTFPPADSNTIRFRSLRRTIDGDVRRQAFENGIRGDMQSTTHAARVPKRKTVVGLFDSSGHASQSGSSTAFTPLKEIHPAKSQDEGRLSPPLSLLSLEDGGGMRAGTRHPTLGSELGSEFGDVFTGTTGAGHFHTASLYGLESLSAAPSIPASPSGSVILNAADRSCGPSAVLPFPSRLPDEPATPQNQALGGGDVRMRRLSATVRARTHRWVDRRLQDSFQSLRLPPEAPETPASMLPADTSFASTVAVPPHPALRAIDKVFNAVDTAVERIALLTRLEGPSTHTLAGSTSTATVVPVERPLSTRRKLTATVLELWLWIQFTIIVLVFVYAMAKRGPKSILKDADRKRGKAL